MRRVHFFEIGDQPWCPSFIRDSLTEFLQYYSKREKLFAPVAPIIRLAIDKLGTNKIVDLGSGAGGPWAYILPEISDSNPLQVYLTDKHPNPDAFNQLRSDAGTQINYSEESIDAADVPSNLPGFRTMFSSFHHFNRSRALDIINDAVVKRQGIGIFEWNQRSITGVLFMGIAPFGMLLFAPFIRPFRWSRLFFSYVIPVLPWTLLFDGCVSCFRIYSRSELSELTKEFHGSGYTWEIGEVRNALPFAPVTYLVGYPSSKSKQSHSTSHWPMPHLPKF